VRSIRRILVAVKNPRLKSSPAVAKAVQLARALGAQLELFHAIATPLYVDAYFTPSGTLKNYERATRKQRLKELESLAERVRGSGIKVTIAADWDYPVYEAVLRRASRTRADLIVTERHLGRHLAPGLLQLTDWELLRLSPAPVLIVKSAAPYKHPVVLAAVDPAHTFSKPANLDREILSAGSLVAGALRGSLHAMHAFIPIPAAAISKGILDQGTCEAFEKQAAANAKRSLDTALRLLKIPAARRHLVPRHPIDAIEQTAREIRSAIVVMGAVSRSGLKRFFIGNTAESVLDHLTCDILIVKPAHFKLRVPRAPRGADLVALLSVAGM